MGAADCVLFLFVWLCVIGLIYIAFLLENLIALSLSFAILFEMIAITNQVRKKEI